ncbi:hypothetical protein T265_02761 [Opisthorchis viverrini]|uniref:Uncharacterized protein n=1 Tax=Opisthorchis viverrini TaxID=6198 RepID=A0A074ZTZ4_OPIVI|nr:hypothetical protein T265_02761 [Opisthorchis viverrini]KER30953.1 hypothetical protein T265_02761 [Opisthorchis viverrini]
MIKVHRNTSLKYTDTKYDERTLNIKDNLTAVVNALWRAAIIPGVLVAARDLNTQVRQSRPFETRLGYYLGVDSCPPHRSYQYICALLRVSSLQFVHNLSRLNRRLNSCQDQEALEAPKGSEWCSQVGEQTAEQLSRSGGVGSAERIGMVLLRKLRFVFWPVCFLAQSDFSCSNVSPFGRGLEMEGTSVPLLTSLGILGVHAPLYLDCLGFPELIQKRTEVMLNDGIQLVCVPWSFGGIDVNGFDEAGLVDFSSVSSELICCVLEILTDTSSAGTVGRTDATPPVCLSHDVMRHIQISYRLNYGII